MKGLSYKDLLTNMLIVFINKRVNESKNIAEKVESLGEEKKKKFHQKVVDFVINKAKSLAEIQGTQYLGVEDEIVVNWINDFFDEFEENMKEPEKKVIEKSTTTSTKPTTTSNSLNKTITYNLEEGLMGVEVIIDKKSRMDIDDFKTKTTKENEGKIIEFKEENNKLTVTIKSKETKKKEPSKKDIEDLIDAEEDEKTLNEDSLDEEESTENELDEDELEENEEENTEEEEDDLL
jgi:hypothetical protein